MARRPGIHWPTGARTIFFDDVAAPATLTKAVAEGRIRKLAPRTFTADLASGVEEVIAANRWKIVARLLPEALVSDRSAAHDGRLADGWLYVVAESRRKMIRLPGLTVAVRPGRPYEAPEFPVADSLWAEGLRMSSAARTLLDNLKGSRSGTSGPSRTLKLAELEDWLARKAITWRDVQVDRLRDDAIALARALSDSEAEDSVQRLFDQLSGRLPLRPRAGPLLVALRRKQAWDERRVEMFERVKTELAHTEEWNVPAWLPESVDDSAFTLGGADSANAEADAAAPPAVLAELAFYESYFSNYIEGTEFTLEEARHIVESQQPPAARPADGHDILGTHSCVADPVGRSATSDDPEELIGLLTARHASIMRGRPDVGPGVWKTLANSVGSYVFVAPELVHGTLLKGLALTRRAEPGFRRALFVLFVVSEVHPFADGNGRVSRVMMNAELSHAGQARIVIPNVFRNEYVSALRRASTENGNIRALARVLAHAWQWTATMPWTDRGATEGKLYATNALLDSTEASQTGRRLLLP